MKITIIVPVYNTGRYLRQCLESILQQTHKDLQIICINDGSEDNSKQILNEFKKYDKRIRVVSQENRGYGAVLNRGIQMAEGDFINIVESDDFIDPFTIESFTCIAERCDWADVIKFAYWDYFENQDSTHKLSPSMSSNVASYLYPFRIAQYPELLLYHPSIWSCIYRRDFLIQKKIRFPEPPGAGWVDNPFFFSTLVSAEKILWSNEKHYYYRRTNPDCSSNLKDCRIPFQRLLEISAFLESQRDVSPVIWDYFYKRCLIYIETVMKNEYYVPDEINPLIFNLVNKIEFRKLQKPFFTDDERKIHSLFTKEGQKI